MPTPEPAHTPRDVVVVDVESTGLPGTGSIAVEIAWWSLRTEAHGVFIPVHTIEGADPYALNLNGYHERIAGEPFDDGTELARFYEAVTGNVLAGANPRVDASWISDVLTRAGYSPAKPWQPIEPWHHRLYDVSSVAYGTLGLWTFGYIPGLKEVCDALGVSLDHHEAANDVYATVECLRALEKIIDERRVAAGSAGSAGGGG